MIFQALHISAKVHGAKSLLGLTVSFVPTIIVFSSYKHPTNIKSNHGKRIM